MGLSTTYFISIYATKGDETFSAWCQLKGHTYLNPAAFSCMFPQICMTFQQTPGVKGSNFYIWAKAFTSRPS